MFNKAKVAGYTARLPENAAVQTLFQRYGIAYRWMAVAVMCLANFATLSSSTMINVAIPEIMTALTITQETAQSLASFFLGASTIAMLLSSWLVLRLGMRFTLLAAASLFVIASVIGSLSDTIETLMLARIAQGVSTGLITPMAMSLIFFLFPAGQQGLAMGLTTAGMVLSPAIGPAIAGLLIDYWNWRYVFLMGVPAALIVIPLAIGFVPGAVRTQKSKRFDWSGFILISCAVSFLLYGLMIAADATRSWLMILAGLVIGIAFITWERHLDYPLVEIKLLHQSKFRVLTLISFMFGAGLYGTTYLLPLFFQLVHGMSATQAGVLLLPAGLIMGLCFPFSGRLADRIPVHHLISVGFLMFGVSTLMFSFTEAGTGFLMILGWLILGRLGIGLLGPALILSSFSSLPDKYVHQSAGIMNFARQMGGAFGVCLAAICLQARSTSRLQDLCHEGLPCSHLSAQLSLSQGFSDSFQLIAIAFILLVIPAWHLRVNRAGSKYN